MAQAKRDENRVPTLLAVSSADSLTPVVLEAEPVNKALNVYITGGSSSGTEYTEGATDATITGTAILWEDAANTLVTVNATKPLPVDLGSNNDVSINAGSNIIGIVDNIPTDYELAGNTLHVKKYYTSAGAATDGIIWSPAAGKRWYVTDIIINVSAAATVTLEDDLTAGDSVVFKAELAANSGISHSFNTPLFSDEDAADLLITTSAGNVYVTVTGYEV